MSNNADLEYFKLLNLVLDKGKLKNNRTGVPTLGVFGAQARFDLSEGFPLLTTKKVFFKSVIHELLWFFSGSTNIKYLVDNGVNIWNGNCFDRFKKLGGCDKYSLYTQVDFIETLKKCIKCDKPSSKEFVDKWGELGEGTYGGMWRAFPFFVEEDVNIKNASYYENRDDCIVAISKVDQIQKLLDKLKTNPDDRRLIVSAWHPYWVDNCALPPCHCLFQFHTEELTIEERVNYARNNEDISQDVLMNHVDINSNGVYNEEFLETFKVPKRRLNCQLYQRSCDAGLGASFNIASYSLLLSMVAQVVNMVPGEFVWSIGDLHIYYPHIEPLKEQMKREPFSAPKLVLNPNITNLFDFKFEDIKIENYQCHPSIQMDMAV